jgi:nitrogen-specific signal transduction histidine kinase
MKPEVPSPTLDGGRKERRPSPRSRPGEPPGWEAERRRLQTEKFQALNQLAGGLSHEFNNLMAGILSSAELVAMDLPEHHPSHENLKHLFEASNHARDFVHRLRALGQRPPLEFKPIRPQPLVEECVQILRTIIPDKVELQVRLSAECPKINADAAQLHQAILEVCLHSWQGLADRRGRISISLERHAAIRRAPGGPPPGSYVLLTVQDDSPGLDKRACEEIFHPFRHRRAGGTKVGLEMFLVRETIRGHQGEVVLETEPGRGLKFQIYLPVARNPN